MYRIRDSSYSCQTGKREIYETRPLLIRSCWAKAIAHRFSLISDQCHLQKQDRPGQGAVIQKLHRKASCIRNIRTKNY